MSLPSTSMPVILQPENASASIIISLPADSLLTIIFPASSEFLNAPDPTDHIFLFVKFAIVNFQFHEAATESANAQ